MSTLRRLLAAEVVSTTGSQLTNVALPWFVLTTTGSATRSGLVLATEIAPVVLFGVASGGWTQRLGARRTMLLADAARAPLVALVPLLYWLGALPFGALLAIVFATGLFITPYAAGQQILLARVCGPDERALTRATSTLQSATRLTLLLGPPAAGALIGLAGAPTVLVLDGVTFLLVLPLIASMPADPPQVELASPARLLDGVATVWADVLLRTWTGASVLSEAAYQAVFVAFPVLTIVRYHASAVLAGALLAAFGAGAVLGSVCAARLSTRVDGRRLAVTGKILTAAAFVALVPAWPPAGLLVVAVALGLGNGLANGPVAAIRLLRLAASQRPRALTAMGTVTWIGGMAGLIAAGPVLDATSPTVLFVALAVVVLVSVTIFVVGARAAEIGSVPTARPDSVTATEGDRP